MRFIEWLFNQELNQLLDFSTLREAVDPLFSARRDLNSWLNRELHMEDNPMDWMGAIVGNAAYRSNGGARGARPVDVASNVMSKLFIDLTEPNSKLLQKLQPHIQAGNKTDIIKIMRAALARRTQTQARYRTSAVEKASHIGGMQGKDGGKSQFDTEAPSTSSGVGDRPGQEKEADFYNRMLMSIQMELEKMANAPGVQKQSRERILLAKDVVAKKMENPSEFLSLDTLVAEFPHIKRGRLDSILDDIQQATSRVYSKEGLGSLVMAANRGHDEEEVA